LSLQCFVSLLRQNYFLQPFFAPGQETGGIASAAPVAATAQLFKVNGVFEFRMPPPAASSHVLSARFQTSNRLLPSSATANQYDTASKKFADSMAGCN
jgi:hypothetical protein